MAESSSSPQPNQPPRPRQNQPAKKGNPLGCLLPLGIAGFFFAQQYLPSWSWVFVFGFILVAIIASSANNAKKRQRPARVQSAPPAQRTQQGGPQIASTQFPPAQPQPQYRPQYVAPPPPQMQRPQPAPQPVPQPRPQPQPRSQAQPPPQPRSQGPAKPQAQPRPRMQPVPGTEHLAPALIGRVTDLKLKGQTVEAIETLREATAMELYEASQIVRRLGQPAKDPAAARDLDSDDFGDVDTFDRFDTFDPYKKADDELERQWKKADEELDRAWQRELELDRKKWDEE